ncbi:centrosomal protein of 95 kDa-like isoform X3 [Nerophis ophidion]|uniref:centrosomal protein of 95 kDa-like isoform X3 n=1 Tax=Nerophis ophidion TaxID=159077 RepID=UPI002ADF0899|nr:centrosomal protein of 95 kDa-like isoform X3 [Nerophis ophidion]
MGTPQEERDWVNVANDLLVRCHIGAQRLTKLTDCDANVFVCLYENILREKVPDYISTPSSQEDDIHNVQSVIDSLSLDYLQISLSHITGENIIQGDQESIKNLLDIFDGLLEYLSEEISESSHNDESGPCNGGLREELPKESEESTNSNAIKSMDTTMEGTSLSSDGGVSAPVSSKSSENSGKSSEYSSKSERMESACELLGFGVSALTFTDRLREPSVQPLTTETIAASTFSEDPGPLLSVALHPAIALHPPAQSDSPYPQPPAATIPSHTSTAGDERIDCNGLHSPARSERDSCIQERSNFKGETLENELPAESPSPPDTEEEDEEEEDMSSVQLGGLGDQHKTLLSKLQEEEEEENSKEPQSPRREEAEKELRHIKKNVYNRVEELHDMLKRVSGSGGEPAAVRKEQETSQLSERVTQPHSIAQQSRESPNATHRSSFTSPPSAHHYVEEHSEDEEDEALSLEDDGTADVPAAAAAAAVWQSEPLHRGQHSQSVVKQPFEEEFRRLKSKKRVVVDKERHKAQEAEREYREAILKDFPPMSPSTTKSWRKLNTQATSGRLRIPKKSASVIVRENELLPVLQEELPFLQVSSWELERMWQQQRQQVERLHALSSHKQRRGKLCKEMEEAERKHDLLVGMVHRQQEHSRRLRDFKEHVQQQKSTQNRLRDQRQQVARARKYHQDYHVQHRARLMKARTKEEKMFRQLFEEGLEMQKTRLREQRDYATEQRQQHHRQHQDHIQSMENYYRDQFSLLAEKVANERQEIQMRKKAQEKVLLKMKRELRSRMEREVSELQKIIIQNDEDDYFQDLEVQRLRSRVRMASFQYRKNHLQ